MNPSDNPNAHGVPALAGSAFPEEVHAFDLVHEPWSNWCLPELTVYFCIEKNGEYRDNMRPIHTFGLN